MCAKTTIMASPLLKENKFWLNGAEQSFDNPRLINCLTKMKKRCNQSLPHLNWNISICSENNFPTAAGLASSAAGYACLVYALAQLYDIQGEISDIARQGSGSACRSIYGGWVQWHKGVLPTGEDSIAKPFAQWPEMRVLILVINDRRKKYSSTSGMRRSVETSTLLKHRVQTVVPERVEQMRSAILNKDFDKFAEITMKDSNSMHAVVLDTYPPCSYMNDVSHAVADLVHAFNAFKKENMVAYTFDAGPNACIYLLEPIVEEFISIVNNVFPKPSSMDDVEYYRGNPLPRVLNKTINDELRMAPHSEGMLKYIIYTKVGDGCQMVFDEKNHLLQENGLPRRVSTD